MNYYNFFYGAGFIIIIAIIYFSKMYKETKEKKWFISTNISAAILMVLIISQFLVRYKTVDKVFSNLDKEYRIVDTRKTNKYDIVYYKYNKKNNVYNSAAILKKDKLGYKIHDFDEDDYDNRYNYVYKDADANFDISEGINYEVKVLGKDNNYLVFYSCKKHNYENSAINYEPCEKKFEDTLGNNFEYEEDGTGYFWMEQLPKDYKVWIVK
jgi:hypothetical protein